MSMFQSNSYGSNMGGGYGMNGGNTGGGGAGASGSCYKCGGGGHWARDCPSGGQSAQQGGNSGGGYSMNAGRNSVGGGSKVLDNFEGLEPRIDTTFDYATTDRQVVPISALTPVGGNAWWIKARVLDKSPVKQWENARGRGVLMSVTLVDESQNAIRATFFKEGVNKYHNMLKPGLCFYFSRGQVKNANKRFSSLPCDYELSFDEQSVVQPMHADDRGMNTIPTDTLAVWTKVKDIPTLALNSTVDLRGLIRELGQVQEMMSKTMGEPMKKLTMQLVDDTSAQIELTLWRDQVTEFQGTVGDVIECRTLRVGQFQNAPQLSCSRDSRLNIVSASQEAMHLKQWYQSQDTTQIEALSKRLEGGRDKFKQTLEAVAKDGLGKSEKPDYLNARVWITHIRDENMWYDACPKKDTNGRCCHKKLTPSPDGTGYRCEHPFGGGLCPTNLSMSEALPRYIAGIKVEDATSSTFVTAFDEAAVELFGCTAQNMKMAPETLQAVKSRCEWKRCLMTLRLKEDTNPQTGEARVKHNVQRCKLLDTEADIEDDMCNMLDDIDKYHRGEARTGAPRAP